MFRDFLRAEKVFRFVDWGLCRRLENAAGNINLTKD